MKNEYWIEPDGSIGIRLTRNQCAVFDAKDERTVGVYRWYAQKRGAHFVPSTKLPRPGHETLVMSQAILRARVDDGEVITYLDGDPLNNRRSNLIVTSRREIVQKLSTVGKSSSHPGVTWNASIGKWQVSARNTDSGAYIGCFDDEIVAAAVYRVFCATHGFPVIQPHPDVRSILIASAGGK
jgi:hypothetical protein